MNEDDLRDLLTEEFPDAPADKIDLFVEWAIAAQSAGTVDQLDAGTAVQTFQQGWLYLPNDQTRLLRGANPVTVIREATGAEGGMPIREALNPLNILERAGREEQVKGWDKTADQSKPIDPLIQNPEGDFQPVLDTMSGEVIDPRFIRVPQLGLIRMEEYLTRWLTNDPLVAAHQQQLLIDQQRQSPQATRDILAFQQAQMQYLDTPMQPTGDTLVRGAFGAAQRRQNPQYLGFEEGAPTSQYGEPGNDQTGRISQLPPGAQMPALNESEQQAVDLAQSNRMRYTYAWGAMSPTRMRTWMQTQTPEVQSEFQLLAVAMGITDEPQALIDELGRGFGPATAAALEEFGQQMFIRRDSQTLNEFVAEQIDANFNNAASGVVSARAMANLDDALGDTDATAPVITLSTTKPEDMEDQLRDMVGELFGERQALSQAAIDEIVQGGLAREREAALQGSAQYQQALLDAERKANENPSFEDATIAAFLDATYTGFGSGAQQYMGMTRGMYENLAGMIGVTDLTNITPEEEQVIAKLWAETMISQANGNIPQAFANANISQLQGRTLDAQQPYDAGSGAGNAAGQGIRGSVPGLYNQGVVESSNSLVPDQMSKFQDSIEAMTGLSYVDLVAGNYNNTGGGTPPPIVIDAPRFDMVRYLRRAAINTNPQKFAKADMRRRMETWINDLIMAESPARMG